MTNSKPKKQRKEHIFSIRMKKSLLKEISQTAKKERISKSDFIRKSISNEISFQEFNRFSQTNFLGPNMVEYALKFMDELEIEDFAKLAMLNGRKFLSQFLEKQKTSSITKKYLKNKKSIMSGLLQYITQSILPQSAQNWFQRITYSLRGNQFVITGIHRRGEKFSLFIRHYFIHFFNIFEFNEIKSKMIIGENRLKLVFSGQWDEFDIKKIFKTPEPS